MCIFRLASDVGSENVCVVMLCVLNTFIEVLQKFMSSIFSLERTVHLFCFTLLFMSISKVYKISSQQGGSDGRGTDLYSKVFRFDYPTVYRFSLLLFSSWKLNRHSEVGPKLK
jgi:hypothetical protein